MGIAVFKIAQPKGTDVLHGCGASLFFGDIHYFQAQFDVFKGCTPWKKGIFLKNQTDSVHVIGDFAAIQQEISGGRFFQSRDDPQKRCFAAAAGSHNGHEPAVIHLIMNIIQNLNGFRRFSIFKGFAKPDNFKAHEISP